MFSQICVIHILPHSSCVSGQQLNRNKHELYNTLVIFGFIGSEIVPQYGYHVRAGSEIGTSVRESGLRFRCAVLVSSLFWFTRANIEFALVVV